ncbi:MAG: adenylate/guanylate cyclase domain-containing protein [Polyangiaceae bacterium]
MRLAFLMQVVLGSTVVLAPMAWMYGTADVFRGSSALGFAVWRLWFPFATVFVLVSAAGYAIRPGPRDGAAHKAQRALLLLTIVLGVCTNQVSMWIFGTLSSPAAGTIVILVSVYRVFVDYRSGVQVAVLAAAGFLVVGLLEAKGVLPAEPLAIHQGESPAYRLPLATNAMLQGGLGLIFLCFMAVNYGVNQSVKLHAYITNMVLRRYLPPELVDKASRGELDVERPPERTVVTVMFTDLVGFTAMSERLGAEGVGELLNRYLAGVAKLGHEHGATVDKFVGDAVMIVFGAPAPLPAKEQASRAVALAKAVHAFVPTLDGLSARTGINTGEAISGNFGSEIRSDYTVIGPAVNVAARLEGKAGPGRIILGESTAKLLEGVELEDVGELELKGVSAPVRAYRIAL